MYKKIVSFLIAFCLVVTLVPSFAGTTYAATKKKCSGVTSVSKSIKFNVITVNLKTNSCDTKKVVEYLDDASSASGAAAGIMAAFPVTRELGSTTAGVVAGVLWANKFAIKKISGDGKYGMTYTIKYTVGLPAPLFYYWKQ